MWHEARKQEKKIRTMVVDYRRRAERRREFYEKFKADPAQFMQVHGRPCKIYLDSQITAAADKCMMPWSENKDNMIDRFDVRAHLDIIPEHHSDKDAPAPKEDNASILNYERYRILIQNESSKTSEDKFLHQIHIEEQFGTPTGPGRHHHKDKEKSASKAAIGYNYEDSNPTGNTWSATVKGKTGATGAASNADPEEEESEEEVDFDLLVNMDDLTYAQKAELNVSGTKYGLTGGDFMNFLNEDLEEKEQMRLAKLHEEEKQTMSGRKARRERRAYKDKLILRKGYISPPSYAAAHRPLGEGEEDEEVKRSSSESRSSSPEKIEFITSFGENEAEKESNNTPTFPILGPALPSTRNLPRPTRKWARSRSRSPERRKIRSRSRTKSRSRSRSRGRSGKYASSRSNKRDLKRSSSSSSDSSRDRSRRRRRRSSSHSSSSRSRDRNRDSRRKQRSRTRSRNGKRKISSRSKSRDRRGRRGRSLDRRRRRSRSNSSSSSSSRSRSPKRGRKSQRSSSSSRSRSPRRPKSTERAPSSNSNLSKCGSSSTPLPLSTMDNKNGKPVSPSLGSTATITTLASVVKTKTPPPRLPSPPVRRYYGRRKETTDSDSDKVSLSSSSDDDKVQNKRTEKSSSSGPKGKTFVTSSTKGSSSHSRYSESSSSAVKLTPQERLKKKMQTALNRQLKVDKEAEKIRQEKQDQERTEREETLRELSIKYRKRERERRHREMVDRNSRSGSSSDHSIGFRSSQSRSPSPPPPPPPPSRRTVARTRSNSPE